MLSFFIETYGCQMNVADSSEIQELLLKASWKEAKTPLQASLAIINTCSVRKTAEDRVLGRLGYYKWLKTQNPSLKLAIMGCFAQKEQENLKKSYPVLDYVIGTRNRQAFYSILENWNAKPSLSLQNSIYTSMENHFDLLPFAPDQIYPHKALISIIKGCDNFCTYCIVPYTRGREISLESSYILKEIEKLVQKGVKEVFLLGQNVNSYGNDNKDISFAQLLTQINAIKGIKRIKFMTSHPKDLSDELIDAIAHLPKLSKHLHLPLQSGSNKILSLMNRKYTYEHFKEKINLLRQKHPLISLTTDILTGFPEENQEDFEHTLNALQELKFDRSFIFMYSPREGTKSYSLKETLTLKEKKQRVQKLIALQKEITKKQTQRFFNLHQQVLIDGESKKKPQELIGFSTYEIPIILQGSPALIGKMVKAQIIKQVGNTLKGKIIS